MNDAKTQSLFHIYNSEQNTLLRLDQKAYTLISFIGVLMAFFIVHHKNIPENTFVNLFTFSYFVATIISVTSLLLVIVPRILSQNVTHHGQPSSNPMYFAGIISHGSPDSYHDHIENLIEDSKEFRRIVSDSIFNMALINQHKKRYFQIGVVFFTLTLYLEILIILCKYLSE